MNKKEMIALIAEENEITKVDATDMYEAVYGALVKALTEGNEVAIPNLGKFVIKDRAERAGHNPITNESIVIPAKKVVVFKVNKYIKAAVAEL